MNDNSLLKSKAYEELWLQVDISRLIFYLIVMIGIKKLFNI